MTDEEKYCIDKCKGKCCKEIGIDYSSQYLKKSFIQFKTKNKQLFRGKAVNNLSQIKRLYRMLLPLKSLGYESNRTGSNGKWTYWYKCKNLKDGRCAIQANKPNMCKDFGQDGERIPKFLRDHCIYANIQEALTC